jgi:beta-glucosidase
LAAGGGDKKNISLPASQIAYLKALRKGSQKPIIVVLTAGSALDVSAITPYADAIIYAWYPGEQGGNALADILFGNVSPSGRLPVTFYNAFDDLPAYENYAMAGRTYRYYGGKVQYPFGFGLSYVNFKYNWQQAPLATYVSIKDTISFSLNIANMGKMNAAELVQVYISYPGEERMPIRELKSFKKVMINSGQSRQSAFAIPIQELQKWDTIAKSWKVYPGKYSIIIGENATKTILEKEIFIDRGKQ